MSRPVRLARLDGGLQWVRVARWPWEKCSATRRCSPREWERPDLPLGARQVHAPGQRRTVGAMCMVGLVGNSGDIDNIDFCLPLGSPRRVVTVGGGRCLAGR